MEDATPSKPGRPEVLGPPSLSKLARGALIRYRHLIGDLGALDSDSVRHIMSFCNNEELAQIEDGTLAGSNRDLSWYTWDIWFRQYELKFGVAKAAKAELMPLSTPPPKEYKNPCLANGPATADWRGMFERDRAAEQAAADGAVGRLRRLYDAAHKDKNSRSAEVCVIKPGKRKRGSGTSSAPAYLAKGPPAHLADKGKLKMLHDIGLKRARPDPSFKPGGPPPAPPSVKTQPKVTRTVTVHKAAQPVAPDRGRVAGGLFSAALGPPGRGAGSPAAPSRPAGGLSNGSSSGGSGLSRSAAASPPPAVRSGPSGTVNLFLPSGGANKGASPAARSIPGITGPGSSKALPGNSQQGTAGGARNGSGSQPAAVGAARNQGPSGQQGAAGLTRTGSGQAAGARPGLTGQLGAAGKGTPTMGARPTSAAAPGGKAPGAPGSRPQPGDKARPQQRL